MLACAVLLAGAASAKPGQTNRIADVEAAGRSDCPLVNGSRVCLRAGRRCSASNREDYLRAGFECRRRRGRLVLMKAREAVLREGGYVLLQPNGVPSFATALQAFEATVADLPGVKERRGVVGESDSGTAPLAWLGLYRNRLTRAQQAALREVVERDPQVSAAQADPATQQQFDALKTEAQVALEKRGLHFNPAHKIVVTLEPVAKRDADGYTVAEWLWGGGSDCAVHVNPVALKRDEIGRLSLLVHELIHCAQMELYPSLEAYGRGPAWVKEGFAKWGEGIVTMETRGRLYLGVQLWYETAYDFRPRTDLFGKTYDAVSFWQLLRHEGANPWALMEPVTRASGEGGNAAAYSAAIQATPVITPPWGPTLASRATAGREWDLGAPGVALSGPFFRHQIGNGQTVGRTVDARGGYAAALDLTADVVRIRSTNVEGLFRPPGGGDRPLPADETYCTLDDGCGCEGDDQGYSRIGQGEALIGYASSVGGAAVVSGESLEQHCERLLTGGRTFRGIAVLEQKEGGIGEPLAEFVSGSCSVGRRGFTADARAGAWTLHATIKKFDGFRGEEEIYPVPYGRGEPQFTITGTSGPYSNSFLPSGAKPPGGGAMAFGEDGGLFGIAMFPVFNSAANRGVIVAGAMRCRYPRR